VHESPGAITKYLMDRGDPAWQRIVVDDRATMSRFAEICADMMPGLSELLELAEDQVAMLETHDLDQQIDDLLQPHVSLPSGGQLIIEETAALVAIDVDSGAHTRDRDPEKFALAVNAEAVQEIARQMILRNLSGQIVIDMLPLKRRESRDKIQSIFSQALAGDGANCNIFGFSRLGNLELTRRRMGESLVQRFLIKSDHETSPESTVLTMIRSLLRQLDRNPGKSLTVECGAELHFLLMNGMSGTWKSVLERTGPVVVLEKSPEFSALQFDLRIN
jgi:Rne/Rng family ribonuclease